MATATKSTGKRPAFVMNDELLRNLGVSAARVRLDPAPGTATVADVIRIREAEGRLFELIDGTLVEKAMSADASFVALLLGKLIGIRSDQLGDFGMALGPDGFLRLSSRFVRAPDLSFTPWARLPGGTVPPQPVPDLAPDLAVEVLSPKNTRREMARKRREYFAAGVRLVWVIDPRRRSAEVYTSAANVRVLAATDALDGSDVLPGFSVRLADLFARLPPAPPAKRKPKTKRKK